MPTYENSDNYTRTWPSLKAADGTTLELAPSERVELDEPVDDPWLREVKGVVPKPTTPVSTESKE